MSTGWTATDNDCGQDYEVTDQQVTSPKDKGIRVTLDKASQQRVNIRKKWLTPLHVNCKSKFYYRQQSHRNTNIYKYKIQIGI